jgi:hypothetical protein
MFSSASNRGGFRGLLPALFALGTLAGCADADLYFDRRETISLHAGDSVASNIIVQTVDPWPRAAGNRNIPGNGDRMQAAGERYRTGRTIPLKGLSTSSVDFGATPGGGGAAPAAAK